jgi:hypothetical protein
VRVRVGVREDGGGRGRRREGGGGRRGGGRGGGGGGKGGARTASSTSRLRRNTTGVTIPCRCDHKPPKKIISLPPTKRASKIQMVKTLGTHMTRYTASTCSA